MKNYILFMHSDTNTTEEGWETYFEALREQNAFMGGSSIGFGEVIRKVGDPAKLADHLVGYIVVHADNIDAAKALVRGNPVYESGGSVEVRELLRD